MACEGIEEIVHIIPLGYEYDRAVKPFERMKAHRVYLITIADSPKYGTPSDVGKNATQRDYDRRVVLSLREQGIEVVVVRIDVFDIVEVMRAVSAIVTDEKARGNTVSINMSACGRLTSIGATLAGMVHGVRIYYVRADEYSHTRKDETEHGLSIIRDVRVWTLSNFQLVMPDTISLRILIALCEKEQQMKTKEIFDLLRTLSVEGFEEVIEDITDRKMKRSVQSRQLMKLDKTILEKLEKNGYIRKEKKGRNIFVGITESGKYAAHICGMMPLQPGAVVVDFP